MTAEQQRLAALETKLGLAYEQRDAAQMEAHDAKAALAASHERERGLREALSFYAKEYGVGARLASDGGMRARQALDLAAQSEGNSDA